VDREAIELEPGAEWRQDPTGRHQYRLWHEGWTERVSDFGVRATDPYTGPTTAPSSPNAEGAHTATLDSILGPAPARSSRPPRRGPTSTRAKTIGGLAILVGALLAGIGALLPVLDRHSEDSTNYIHLPGNYGGHGLWVALIAIVLALIALLGVLRPQSSRTPAVVVLVVSVPYVALVFSDWRDWNDGLNAAYDEGLGLWSGLTLCLIGAVLIVAGSVTALVAQSRSSGVG
jgi:hypothetical protein